MVAWIRGTLVKSTTYKAAKYIYPPTPTVMSGNKSPKCGRRRRDFDIRYRPRYVT